jgi:hypothetical protein
MIGAVAWAGFRMTDFGDHSPRRYFVDENGRRVLIGLTIEETFEFETLDSLPAHDDSGNHVAWGEKAIPITTREKRWLELYSKHDQAWRQWLAESYADRRGALGFINQDRVT